MKIVTYATHSEGLFDDLVRNKDVTVIGYGDKWEGFIKKANTILTYLNTVADDEIVVIIDGFDSIIKKVKNLEDTFKSMNCKVLVSREDESGLSTILPEFIHSYVTNKVFGTCKNNETANSGLIIGYVKYLKIVWGIISKGTSTDDQRNLNQSCLNLPEYHECKWRAYTNWFVG